MTLSKYLVEHNAKTNLDKSLSNLKAYNRALTLEWMNNNPDFETEMKAGFHSVTDKIYEKNRLDIINGYADHYSEKIFGFSSPIHEYVSELEKISFDASQIYDIQQAIKQQSAIGFIGHFGGMEFIPAFLALHGIPVTVILRFNSNEARERAFEQNKKLNGLDIVLIDVSDNLYSEFRKLKEQKRLLITVYDGFDNWKPDLESAVVYWGLKRIRLDSTPRRLYKMTDKGDIFYISISRDKERYNFKSQKIDKRQSNSIAEAVCKPWLQSIEKAPCQWYIWDEIKEIKSY